MPLQPSCRCHQYTRFQFRVLCIAIMIASVEKVPTSRAMPDFAFLTNHGKTLLLIARDRRIRMRDIAGLLNITERATQRIVADLAIDIGTLLAILSAHDKPEHRAPA